MKVFVEYTVPVLVEVDEDAGAILVRVDDQSIGRPVGIVTEYELSDDQERRAVAVAESADRPAWDLGL